MFVQLIYHYVSLCVMFLKTKLDFTGFFTKKNTQIIQDIIQVQLDNNNNFNLANKVKDAPPAGRINMRGPIHRRNTNTFFDSMIPNRNEFSRKLLDQPNQALLFNFFLFLFLDYEGLTRTLLLFSKLDSNSLSFKVMMNRSI
jgi:hypothetical protein